MGNDTKSAVLNAEWDVGGDREGIITSAGVAGAPDECKNSQAHHTSAEEEHLQ